MKLTNLCHRVAMAMAMAMAVLLLANPVGAALPDFGNVDHKAENVSLVSLIATPERFDGKSVRVSGLLRVEFEGNVICLHPEDLVKDISHNCLWIEPEYRILRSTPLGLSQFNGRRVLVEGVFDKDNHGPKDCCSGATERIWRVMVIETREP